VRLICIECLEEVGSASVTLSARQETTGAAVLEDSIAELRDALVGVDPVVVASTED
jgi:hypothetical protein